MLKVYSTSRQYRRNLLVLSIILVVMSAVVGYCIGWYTGSLVINNKDTAEETVKLNNAITASIEIEQYRDNKLIAVYKKENDPLTRNFIAIIINTFLAMKYQGTPVPITFTDGTILNDFILDNAYNNKLKGTYIAIGNGTGTPSFTDYNMFNSVYMSRTVLTQETHNMTHYIAVIEAYFIIDEDMNITEVGLLLKTRIGSTYKYILLAHDTVYIIAKTYDAIVVKYVFTFTKPFTYNFAVLITRLVLSGLQYAYIVDINRITRCPDFGVDGAGDDLIKEDILMWLGNNPSPLFTMYKYDVSTKIAETSKTPRVTYGYNKTSIWVIIHGWIELDAEETATEVGLLLKTDGVWDYSWYPAWINILYIPLDTTLTGPGIHGVKIILYYSQEG
ncbi:hypothetical protein J4526_05970 [Desulfurococcaceae archaeon MEX13E-LK6-19]|nr:hypothetical protein J4526_05970 [Desulfurococcaceae archaeon MEX13E-LK6-19]